MAEVPPQLSGRFQAAVALATEVHGRQRRMGTGIPYLAHLLVVTGLVLEDGGDEDQAIAAMLHDAVEDGGGRPMLDWIERRFGPRVAGIVEGCSDTVEEHPPGSWFERKRRYLAHLPAVTDDAVLRVALADKVHNARSIVRDYRQEGHRLWERFTQRTAHEQLWYYGGLLAFFQERRPGPLTEDLSRAVSELAWLVARDGAQRHRTSKATRSSPSPQPQSAVDIELDSSVASQVGGCDIGHQRIPLAKRLGSIRGANMAPPQCPAGELRSVRGQ